MLRFTENLPGSGANGSGPPRQQLLHMERRVLEVLGFAFARPTSADFLDLLLGLGDATSARGTKRRGGRRGRAWHLLGAGGVVMEGPGQPSCCSFSCSSSSALHHTHHFNGGGQGGGAGGGGEKLLPLIHARARYLAERALFDGGLVARFAPSRIAAGAVYLSRRHDTPDAWVSFWLWEGRGGWLCIGWVGFVRNRGVPGWKR